MRPDYNYRVSWESPTTGGAQQTVACITRQAALALMDYLTRDDVVGPNKITLEPFVPMQEMR